VDIDLAETPAPGAGSAVLPASPDVRLRRGERLVADVRLQLPGGQWDAEAVLAQLLPHADR
jgi:hypothetical protein